MGLSKIGPANQSQSFLATNVAGTLLYIDPMYVETGILTKESDVYSFGVVLFEVLCGSLCFKQRNDRFQSLVPRWKKSYRDNKLDEIIFPHLKQDMNTRSREIFSEIAYQCLLRSRAKQPKMSHVVEKLELALQFQQGISNPEEFKELVKLSVVNEEEHEMLLSKGIILNEGKTWFSLNEKGEHCEMISAECFIPTSTEQPHDYVPYDDEIKSRLEVRNRRDLYVKFNAHIRTHFLSPNITYKVNLVFMNDKRRRVDHLGIQYKSPSETNYSILFVAYEREDGWLMAELYQFINDTSNVDLEIEFDCIYGIEVEGIEFVPMEEDEDEDEDEETYWERKLPSDYKKIILWGEESLHQATKKELYSLFCKGLPFYFSGEQWISLAKNGKKCHMLSASRALGGVTCPCAWQSLPESRFQEVAVDPFGDLWMLCSSDYLSPETTYATNLVYKLQENHSWFEHPVVCKRILYPEPDPCPWFIYLLSAEDPAITGKFYRKKGLPQQRNDGWMEVQVYEFQTNTRRISIEFMLQLYDFNSLKGLIVQGIEFKPI